MSEPSKFVVDGIAWVGNVATSVAIIFVNKVLMSRTGYGFVYATTLCALHYLACSASIWITQACGAVKKVKLPIPDLVLFTMVADASIVSLNLSLMLNPVGFYQIAKLLIVPFVCLVERFWLGRTFSKSVILSVGIVLGGVAIVTVTDTGMNSNVGGFFVAGLSVISSGMQQILCRTMQQKHKLSSHELLSNTAPAQGWTLLLMGPLLDRYVSRTWVFEYEWVTPAIFVMLASCSFAVLVNITQFACLGRFSAVSYQVLGHSKTVLVLLGGWAFLGDKVSAKQFFGMLMAVAGMVSYGFASASPQGTVKKAPASPLPPGEESVRLLASGSESVANTFRNREDELGRKDTESV